MIQIRFGLRFLDFNFYKYKQCEGMFIVSSDNGGELSRIAKLALSREFELKFDIKSNFNWIKNLQF